MKVCVYGCGAIGGLLAARLAATGNDVSVIARGEHLAAIRAHGLTLLPLDDGPPLNVEVRATDNPADLAQQDVVFLTMKSHAVPAIADAIAPLLGDNTLVVTATNGIPWWYFYGQENRFGAPELTSVDPDKKLWAAIGPQRAIGCVVYPAAAIAAPGIVRHIFGDRFAIGEPEHGASERIESLGTMLENAGFVAPVQDDIRVDIWTKLIANAAFNPVSVVTGKTLGEMIADEATCGFLRKIMIEVAGLAESLEIAPAMSPDQLLDATRQLGAHKTSMLQDLQAGRSLELEPIVGAVLELADMLGTDAGSLRMVHKLAAAKAGNR
jgi:2-dehydropantoate 2-reductase